MTKKEYNNLKIGDKIKLTLEHNRIITLGEVNKSPFFKHQSRGENGIMAGNLWYSYKHCEVIK